jgi:hypothetical protein
MRTFPIVAEIELRGFLCCNIEEQLLFRKSSRVSELMRE